MASETDDGDPATFQDNDFENKITIYLSMFTLNSLVINYVISFFFDIYCCLHITSYIWIASVAQW